MVEKTRAQRRQEVLSPRRAHRLDREKTKLGPCLYYVVIGSILAVDCQARVNHNYIVLHETNETTQLPIPDLIDRVRNRGFDDTRLQLIRRRTDLPHYQQCVMNDIIEEHNTSHQQLLIVACRLCGVIRSIASGLVSKHESTVSGTISVPSDTNGQRGWMYLLRIARQSKGVL
nr:hypothetical protein CFP56_44321 [Quercus suber]